MKMSTKSTLIALRLMPNQNKELEHYSNKYGQSKSELIREAIQVWLGLQWQKERTVVIKDAMA